MTPPVAPSKPKKPMRSPKLAGLLACLSLLCVLQASAQQVQVAVQFLGRDQFAAAIPITGGTGQPAVPALVQNVVAGVVPQAGWNPIDDQYGFDVANVGTTTVLTDPNVTPTPITLTFAGNDSWDNDLNPTNLTTGNAQMMVGILKASAGGGVPATFEFDNVPEGQYDLYVYMDMNGDNTIARVWDADNVTTNFIREQHQFTDASTFIQATATTLDAVTNNTNFANYVKFSNLGTYGRGRIGALAQWVSGNDGIGIAGLQLVPAGASQPNTVPLSFLVEPISRRGAQFTNNVTFTTSIRGPAFSVQWFKNGTPVATGTSYTPDIGAGDNLAQISVTATNNINSITSSNAILTVGQNIGTNNGIIVMDGGIVNITTQPTNVTVVAGNNGAFSVAATSAYVGDVSSAAPPITYQWQTAAKGSSSFSDITGATAASFVSPTATPALDGTQYRVAVNAGNTTVNSTAVSLTVIPDPDPPSALSATVFPNSVQVGIKFNKTVDAASATTASNYKINGVAASAAILRTNVANELTREGNLVSLIAASPISGAFTVAISGIGNVSGAPMTLTNVPGTVLGLTSTDIGSPDGAPGGPDPLISTVVTNWGDGNFDVLCGGNDYYNNADGISFIWEPKTNSFDVKVRVVSVENIDDWSAGAIMVREGPTTPTGGGWELARHYFCKVDYAGPTPCLDNTAQTGANTYEYNCRLATGDPSLRETSNNGTGGSAGWGGAGPGNPSPVPFPNAWIRIARVKTVSNNVTNDHMMGYSSSDGINWSLREDVNLLDAAHAGVATVSNGPPAGPLPDVLYVGLASTAHNNGTNTATSMPYQCWVVYRDFGDMPAAAPAQPTLGAAHNPDGTFTLTFTGNLYSSGAINGTYTKVTGATSPFPVNPATVGAPATFYRAGP